MEIERVTSQLEVKSINNIILLKKLLLCVQETCYDKISVSFANMNLKKCVLLSNNTDWIDKYSKNNLYLSDPLCSWEDKAFYDILRENNKNRNRFADIDLVHNGKNGGMMRAIRKDFNINNGGVSVSYFDDIVLSVGWWSSNKHLDFSKEIACPIRRDYLENILKEIIFIYFQNKKFLFN